MKALASVVVAFAAMIAGLTPARATVFDFTIAGPNISGSGTVTATFNPQGSFYDVTGSTGSLTIYGTRINLLFAFGAFNRTSFLLALYSNATEGAFVEGSNTGGIVTRFGGQSAPYDVFDLQDASAGTGGAPLPVADPALSAVLAGGVIGFVMLRRRRPARWCGPMMESYRDVDARSS